MATLTRDQFLALRAAPPRQAVEIPDFGTALIRILTLGEVSAIQKAREQFKDEPLKLYPKVILAGCIADDGRPLFDPADADAIESLPWPAVDALATAILKFNKMTGDDAPKAPSAAPSGSS